MTESLGQEEYRRSALDDLDEKENPVQDETQQSSDAQSQDPIIGTPEEDAATWDGRQSFPDTCTIRAQEFIIEQFTGEEVDEEALVQEATDSGFYTPGRGTTFEHTGSLLEAHGIPVNQYRDATTYDLADELAQGHKVILSVDAGELSGQEDPILEEIAGIADRDVDHDVVVSGIDTTDPENPQVIVSDPGTGEAGATYPMDQFLAAWQDSSFFMAATQEPVPETAPEMANFPYEEGHVPEVVSIPYEDFVEMRDQMEEWIELLELIAQDPTYASQVAPPEPVPQDAADQGASDQEAPAQEAIDQEAPAQQATEVQQAPAQEAPAQEALTQEPPGQEAVPAELLEPGLPGPTLDPRLFDSNAAGPTIDPCLCNPEAPGATIDPALLDPVEPGLTLDPALLDPNSPGPTLDPGLFDPNAPGLTIDPNAPLPPDLAQRLQDPNAPVAEPQNPVDQTNPGPGVDGGTDGGTTPSMQSFLDGINQRQQETARVLELTERAANGDTEAQAELERMADVAQRQTSMLEGFVSGQETNQDAGVTVRDEQGRENQPVIDGDQTEPAGCATEELPDDPIMDGNA